METITTALEEPSPIASMTQLSPEIPQEGPWKPYFFQPSQEISSQAIAEIHIAAINLLQDLEISHEVRDISLQLFSLYNNHPPLLIHAFNVAVMVKEQLKKETVDKNDIAITVIAALLHDIGKMKGTILPIVQLPKETVWGYEHWREMEEHPIAAREFVEVLLNKIFPSPTTEQFFSEVSRTIETHHLCPQKEQRQGRSRSYPTRVYERLMQDELEKPEEEMNAIRRGLMIACADSLEALDRGDQLSFHMQEKLAKYNNSIPLLLLNEMFADFTLHNHIRRLAHAKPLEDNDILTRLKSNYTIWHNPEILHICTQALASQVEFKIAV